MQGFEFDPDLVAASWSAGDSGPAGPGRDRRRSGSCDPDGARYRFDHHQIQEVVYGELPPGLRHEYHTLLAEAIEARAEATPTGECAEQIARHHLYGREPLRARPHLRAALAWLSDSHRPEEAAALAARALGISDLLCGEERVHVWQVKAAQHDLRGERALELEAAEEALAVAEACGDRERIAQAAVTLAGALDSQNRYDAAREQAERARLLYRELEDVGGEERALVLLGNIASGRGDAAEGNRCYERAGKLASSLGGRLRNAIVVSNLGNNYVQQGQIAEGRALIEEALTVFREVGARRQEAVSTLHVAVALYYDGRYEEACDHIAHGLSVAREIGYRRGEETAAANLALNCFHLGRRAEAEEHYLHWREIAREIGDRNGEAGATNGLGLLALGSGQHDEAEKYFAASLEMARECRAPLDEATALANLAVTAHAEGRLAAARRLYEEAIAIALETGDPLTEARVKAWFGQTLLLLGNAEEAEACLERKRYASVGRRAFLTRSAPLSRPWPVWRNRTVIWGAPSTWQGKSTISAGPPVGEGRGRPPL